jgi:hypothetical protein
MPEAVTTHVDESVREPTRSPVILDIEYASTAAVDEPEDIDDRKGVEG